MAFLVGIYFSVEFFSSFFSFFFGWWKFLAGSGKLYAESVSYVYTGLYCTATLSCLARVFSKLSVAVPLGRSPGYPFL